MTPELIIELADITPRHVHDVGRKAASLAGLAAAGFPVPAGVVLRAAALGHALAGARLDARAATPEQVASLPLPHDVQVALNYIEARLRPGPYAARSSAADEDRADASFAGQYESVLGVPGDQLAHAVRRCWASAFTSHVRAYRSGVGLDGAPAMAVLVQPMIQADTAGVAFTANPVTGDRGSVVVSAVRGLGDRLVSGQVSPDEWLVREGIATPLSLPQHAIDADAVLRVAALARKVEHHFGPPQDIEWASTGAGFVVLQARPITALPKQPGFHHSS